MEIKILRNAFTELSTIGRLFIVDQMFTCYTLEDTDRGLKSTMTPEEIKEIKVWGKTCIPEGRYKIIVTHSNRFKRLMPLLVDVPGFEGVRIHTGNTDEDTEGCILVGSGKSIDRISESVKAYNELFPIIRDTIERGEETFITIQKDDFTKKVIV